MIPSSFLRMPVARLLTILLMMPFLAGTVLAQDGKVYKIVNPDGSVSY